ncbi:MAG: hypothetical protein FD189_1164, partial [Elusimicrobia bacterium]
MTKIFCLLLVFCSAAAARECAAPGAAAESAAGLALARSG